eukprot:scaffold13528_cov126-Isochrysis_galbana.AAC.4
MGQEELTRRESGHLLYAAGDAGGGYTSSPQVWGNFWAMLWPAARLGCPQHALWHCANLRHMPSTHPESGRARQTHAKRSHVASHGPFPNSASTASPAMLLHVPTRHPHSSASLSSTWL